MGILTFDGVDLQEAPKEALPLCPHCRKELRILWYKAEGLGGFGEKQIVMCPHCRSFLSYALWRG
jgi:hypothetical protein